LEKSPKSKNGVVIMANGWPKAIINSLSSASALLSDY